MLCPLRASLGRRCQALWCGSHGQCWLGGHAEAGLASTSSLEEQGSVYPAATGDRVGHGAAALVLGGHSSPGLLAWPSLSRGDCRKESILAFMTPLPRPRQVGCLSTWDVRVGEVSPGGFVPKEAGLGLVAETGPSFGGGTRPCLAREAGLAPSARPSSGGFCCCAGWGLSEYWGSQCGMT